jgi:putative transposase
VMLALIQEARQEGASLDAACARLGVSARTIQRWKKPETVEDRRCGPHTSPANRLSASERRRVLEVANSPEFRDKSPKQIVPALADRGLYVASESTFYRVLREERQLAHRGKTRPSTRRAPTQLEAGAPNEVFTWDITYLRSAVRGAFFYLYLVVDVYSRRIVGWAVHEHEYDELAAHLMRQVVAEAGNPPNLKLHSDNGPAMKGATLLATLQSLGVVPSFSRPRVSDDNPFSEALFRTLKYRPSFPEAPFSSLEAARSWVSDFVRWYNTEHRHSAIRFVTPDERHFGRERDVLERREAVYERARRRHPTRWSRETRNWSPAGPVLLGTRRREKEIHLTG